MRLFLPSLFPKSKTSISIEYTNHNTSNSYFVKNYSRIHIGFIYRQTKNIAYSLGYYKKSNYFKYSRPNIEYLTCGIKFKVHKKTTLRLAVQTDTIFQKNMPDFKAQALASIEIGF